MEVAEGEKGHGERQAHRSYISRHSLPADPSIVLCPMVLCQTPVPKPSGADVQDGTGWERLRTCPSCTYSFCSFCKRTW